MPIDTFYTDTRSSSASMSKKWRINKPTNEGLKEKRKLAFKNDIGNEEFSSSDRALFKPRTLKAKKKKIRKTSEKQLEELQLIQS